MAGRNVLPASVASVFADLLHVVEELEEHDPGEHGQAVEVAVQPLVLAHDVARGLDERPSCWAVVRGAADCFALAIISNFRERLYDLKSQISDLK